MFWPNPSICLCLFSEAVLLQREEATSAKALKRVGDVAGGGTGLEGQVKMRSITQQHYSYTVAHGKHVRVILLKQFY